jgi:hypothetical protein
LFTRKSGSKNRNSRPRQVMPVSAVLMLHLKKQLKQLRARVRVQ